MWVEGTFPLKHQNMLLINWLRPGQTELRVAEVGLSLGSGHKPDWLQSQTTSSPVLRFIFVHVVRTSRTSEGHKLPEDFEPCWKKKSDPLQTQPSSSLESAVLMFLFIYNFNENSLIQTLCFMTREKRVGTWMCYVTWLF